MGKVQPPQFGRDREKQTLMATNQPTNQPTTSALVRCASNARTNERANDNKSFVAKNRVKTVAVVEPLLRAHLYTFSSITATTSLPLYTV